MLAGAFFAAFLVADFLTAFFAVAIALVLVSSLVHALNRLKAANCRGGTDDYREYPEERSAPAVEPAPPAVVLPVVEERRQRVLAELVGTFAAGRVTQLLEKSVAARIRLGLVEQRGSSLGDISSRSADVISSGGVSAVDGSAPSDSTTVTSSGMSNAGASSATISEVGSSPASGPGRT